MPGSQEPRPSTGDAAPEERLRELAEQIAPRHDLLVEGVSVHARGGRTRAVIVLDLAGDEPGSADLDAIADASREISAQLDEDPQLASILGPGPSELEVTTPGADRVLSTARHFRRSRGRLLRITDRDGREIIARLRDVTDADVLVLETEPAPGAKPGRRAAARERIELPREHVGTARVEIEFTHAGDPDPAAADGRHETEEEG